MCNFSNLSRVGACVRGQVVKSTLYQVGTLVGSFPVMRHGKWSNCISVYGTGNGGVGCANALGFYLPVEFVHK